MVNKFKFRTADKGDYNTIISLLALSSLPSEGVADHIENYILLSDDEKIIGVIGLEKYGDSALLRSFAILPEMRNNGLGLKLYNELISYAKSSGIIKIFLLTQTAEKFFARQGFRVISRNDADDAVKESVEFKSACPQSAVCLMLEV